MAPGTQRQQSNILRVGKDLLVLLEMTVLSNKTAGNVSWFTDKEMLELLMLVRNPVCVRVEEYNLLQPEMKRKRKGMLCDSGMKAQPPIMLTGERVKLGLQFVKHHMSRTCLLPKECPDPVTANDEFLNHSGGGFDVLFLFPEKLQVVVCEYMPLTGTSIENQQASSYFPPTSTGGERNRLETSTAKKKKLQLKRIVSSSSGTSMSKKSTHHGEFETSLVRNDSSVPSLPCQEEKEKNGSFGKASSPSLSETEMAATSDVDATSEKELKITSKEARDVFAFESESDQDKMESELISTKKDAKETEMSNSGMDSLAVSVPCQSTSPTDLLDSPLKSKKLQESDALKSGEVCGVIGAASGPKQSKLSLKRNRRNRNGLTLLNKVEPACVEKRNSAMKPGNSTALTNSDTDIQTYSAATLSLSGKKRKWECTTIEESPAKQDPKHNEEQDCSAVSDSCNSLNSSGKSHNCSPEGKKRKKKLTKKLSQIRRSFDVSSSDDDDIESFNIDVFRLLKENRKKLGKKSHTNSESGIPKDAVNETEAFVAKRREQSDNALSSGDDAFPSADFLKGTSSHGPDEAEDKSSKEGGASPTFDRMMKTSKGDGVLKYKQQSESFLRKNIVKKKSTRVENSSGVTTFLSEEKSDDKSEKESIAHSDSDVPALTFLIEDSREAKEVEENVLREKHSVVDSEFNQIETDAENSAFSIASKCKSPVSGCHSDDKHVRERTITPPVEKENLDEKNLKDETCQNITDVEYIPDLDKVEQKDYPVVKSTKSTEGKIFSFHDDSRYCVKEMTVIQGEERTDGQNSEFSSKSLQGDFLSDDDQQENVCSSLGFKKPTSNKGNFFQADVYENVESQNDSMSFDMKFNKALRNKKPPLRAKNSQNGGSFKSLKRFDDTTAPKKLRNSSSQNRRCSQIQVTPQNLDKWWLPKDGKRKERKSEVVDLVAMEEKMEAALKSVKSVSELTEEQLRYLTQNNEDYLKAIFQGKKPCPRHQEYKSSSAVRAQMTYLVSYGDFPEDSLETIMDTLVPMFCKKGSKYLDYVSKVLLPELLVKICMDVLHVSYEEAEKMF